MSELAQKLIAENIARHERGEDASYLDLGNCGLRELPDLSGMDWLETLVLSSWWTEFHYSLKTWFNYVSQNSGEINQFKKLPPLHSHLPLLKKLVGCNIGIKDGIFVEKLDNLRELDLSFNQINNIQFLKELPNLTSVDLSRNTISDIQYIKYLTKIKSLNLSYSQITAAEHLRGLTKLEFLDLSANHLSEGQFLENLTNLTFLFLSHNQISDIKHLEKLTDLTSLSLTGNQIRDGRFIQKLTKLSYLHLSHSKIRDWSFMERLGGLTLIHLSNNQINDGAFLGKLTNLTHLYISNNQITDGQFLKKLTNLKEIDLTNNSITDLRPLRFLFEERGLRVVWKDWHNKKIEEINVKDNPITNPPPEIVQQGNEAILEYFRQKEKTGTKLLLEAKMVLLGDGRAGKTSLACRMLGRELPKQEDRTLGVDIAIGEYRFPVEEGEFVLHIWDFAGQDKYKPLHQFFYTEGAVYVMVADSGNAQTDFADWFETVKMFGGEGSPLLVALNEFREDMGKGSFDEEKWRKQFPKLIKEVRLVNLLSEEGFPVLEKDIRHLANQLPHTRTKYPTNWANIRAELERRRDENYISLGEYLKVCRQFDLPERKSALILSGILHQIGVCLHYQKSDLLCQHIILKNEWATAAVYKILEDQIVAEEKKGFFNKSDIQRIWSDDVYLDMHPQLLQLMCEFKMAYPLPNQKEFVAPPLLPPTPPHDLNTLAGFENLSRSGQAIEVLVEYEFLPKALITQFIVSRHQDIDRDRTLVWREGVVLRWSDTLAQVSRTRSRGRDALQIMVTGSDRRGLLTSILKTLRDLHSDYRGIKAYEIVPCPCQGCRTEQNAPHYFDFKNLTNRLEKGRRMVECDQSLGEVDLLKILGDLLVFEHLGVGEAVVLKDVQREGEAGALRVFIAYSKHDTPFKDTLLKHLAGLRGKAVTWHDRDVLPGEKWDARIKTVLAEADVVLYLVTHNSLATEYIHKVELPLIEERCQKGECVLIPVIVDFCVWEELDFAKYNALPEKGHPITDKNRWQNENEAWMRVVEGLVSIPKKS